MAGRLMRGQSVILRGRDAPMAGKIFATCGGVLVAVGDVEKGELVPHRVFNLAGFSVLPFFTDGAPGQSARAPRPQFVTFTSIVNARRS